MKTKSIITISRKGEFAATGFIPGATAGQKLAQLRLTITGDELVVGNNEHAGVLDGISPEKRVLAGLESIATCLFPVKDDVTLEALQTALDKANESGATLYARISRDITDVLGSNQLSQMDKANRKSREAYEATYGVTNPKSGEFMGYYRVYYFSPVPKDDVDLRSRAASPAAVVMQQTDTTNAPVPASPAAVGADATL